MRMANFIVRDAIIPDLKAATRDEAIREVVDSLSAAGSLPAADRDDIIKAILRASTLGTTGIGHNIAIPHFCLTPAVRPVARHARHLPQRPSVRQHRRRAGACDRDADLAAGPPRRPPAGPGKRGQCGCRDESLRRRSLRGGERPRDDILETASTAEQVPTHDRGGATPAFRGCSDPYGLHPRFPPQPSRSWPASTRAA